MPVDHYENFPVASLLLPARLRAPIEAIYRFARSADDIADEGDAAAQERLAALATYLAALDRINAGEDPRDPRFPDLAAVIQAHRLPTQLFRDLIDAFSQDVTTRRYADTATLHDYCRRSANPVGRLLLHLVGVTDDAALSCSDRICTALQLINFLQDVTIDWRKDRVYLPQDTLARFGVSETQIAAGLWSPAWAALMDFEIDRTRALMLAGTPLLARLRGRMRWEIRATVNGGLRILDRLQQVRGDIFARRPTLAARDWWWIAARTVAGRPA
jgi:squalene synthase HpnC